MRQKNSIKNARSMRAATVAAWLICAVLLLTAVTVLTVLSGMTVARAAEEGEGELDIVSTEAPEGSIDPDVSVDPETTEAPTDTPDPNATPIPTYNGNIIKFEVPEGGGKKNTSSAGGIIMIIIIALAFISVASGIVEKIVRYYKGRDDRFSKE